MKCKGRKFFFNTKNADNGNNSNLTLAKVVARRAINFGKVCAVKVIHLSYQKETEKFGRGEGGFLVKKGCKEGGVSL